MNRVSFSRLLSAAVLMTALCVPAWPQTMTFTEWAVPTADSLPLHIVSASDTMFYFTESNTDRVSLLNTAASTDQFTEWKLPGGGLPHGIVLSSGMVDFCAFGGNYIGVLNPNTSELTEWPIPTQNSGVIHLDVSGSSSFVFSEATGNNVGVLNTSTSEITEWPVPTAGSAPRGIVSGQGAQVFFVELNSQKIAMLNTSTNTITEWTLPLHFSQVEHVRFYQGLVIFGDLGSSWLGALNPVTNVLESGQAPTANAAIPDVFISAGLLNFTERAGNKMGLFNPAHQTVQTQTLSPVVTVVTPTTTAVTPQGVQLAPTLTTVSPVITNVNGVVTGGFTEWTVPTAASGPMGINVIGSTVVFTEYYGNNVATLTPAN